MRCGITEVQRQLYPLQPRVHPETIESPAHLAADALLLCLELIEFLLRSVMVTLNLAQRTVCRAAARPAVIAVQQ
jgi:hypothetical protein